MKCGQRCGAELDRSGHQRLNGWSTAVVGYRHHVDACTALQELAGHVRDSAKTRMRIAERFGLGDLDELLEIFRSKLRTNPKRRWRFRQFYQRNEIGDRVIRN